jgi:hypothetical protein
METHHVELSPFTWAPEGWPKWSHTSACQLGDPVVDTPYETQTPPGRARFRPSRSEFGGFRGRPEVTNPKFRLASESLSGVWATPGAWRTLQKVRVLSLAQSTVSTPRLAFEHRGVENQRAPEQDNQWG